MSKDLQESWDQLLGKKPKHSGAVWLGLGALLGIAVQIGPGLAAGIFEWSLVWPVSWGIAVGFYASIVKSKIGRGILSGNLPPHWISALLIGFPVSAGIFSAFNFAAYWLGSWISR